MISWRSAAFPILVLACLVSSGAALAQGSPFVPWTQFSASDAVAGSSFGSAVTLSADGSTALVIARSRDCAGNPDCGLVAYVFAWEGGGWVQQAELTAPGGIPWKRTLKVALSGDGGIALFGVYNTDCAAGLDCGTAYAFTRDHGAWTLQQTLENSAHGNLDHFGSEVALSEDGNTALIGASGASCGGISTCGAAYIFTRNGNLWTERQKLTGDPFPGLYFGRNLALSADGSTALVVGGVDAGIFIGKVFVFRQSGGAWSLQGTITPPDANSEFANDNMALSADGNTVLIREDSDAAAGGGSVFVFTRTGTAWTQEAVLHGKTAADDFGRFPVLSGDGDLAVIPARPVGCFVGLCGGTAEVFARNGGAWSRIQEIVPPGFGTDYTLGPVALSGDARTVLLGVPSVSCAAGAGCGAVYAFTNAPLAVGVPTLGGAGLAVLTLLLVVSALILLQRRRAL